MHWYVIHTNPRQEQHALLNLKQQGYECFLPLLATEKLHQGRTIVVNEPLFPCYLFIRLDACESAQSWGPIRSTKGVSRLVAFGAEPAKVDERFIETLHAQSSTATGQIRKLFTSGERILVTDGPFAELEALCKMNDGLSRAIVLIELLSKSAQPKIARTNLSKIG